MEPILQIPLCISVCSRWWMAVWLVVQENAFAKVQKSVDDGHSPGFPALYFIGQY